MGFHCSRILSSRNIWPAVTHLSSRRTSSVAVRDAPSLISKCVFRLLTFLADRLFRTNLSPTALEACSIVDAIRFEESQTLWTPEFEDSLAASPPDKAGKDVATARPESGDLPSVAAFPGMMFMLAKERMERSKLWRIVRRMPKGALLHCHFEAMVDVRWMLELSLSTPGMHYTSDRPLDSDVARLEATTLFQYSKQETPAGAAREIWTAKYSPNTLVPLVEAADAFPSGGRAGFIEWMHSRLTITTVESTAQHEGINTIWAKFISCFPTLGSITSYEPIYRAYIRRMLTNLHEDGIRWVDLRAVFMIEYRLEGDDTPQPDFVEKLGHMQEEIEAFKKSPEGEGFWGARMIWTSARSWGPQQIVERESITPSTHISPLV